jgi:hypothetical protein
MKIDEEELEFHLMEIEVNFNGMLKEIKNKKGSIDINEENIKKISSEMVHLKYHIQRLYDMTNYIWKMERRRNKRK